MPKFEASDGCLKPGVAEHVVAVEHVRLCLVVWKNRSMPNTCSSLEVPKNGSIAQHPFVARFEDFVKFEFCGSRDADAKL